MFFDKLFKKKPNEKAIRKFWAEFESRADLFADILHLLRHPAPAKVSFPSFPLPPHFPDHLAGRTAGSARTRSRGQPLENPFLENDLHCIRLPVPQNAAGGRPLLLGRPPCVRSVAGIEKKRSTQAPYSWGLGA